MALNLINVGTGENTGDGDPLRTAYTKANANDQDLDARKQEAAEKGQVNGYAELDGTGRVPAAQLPPAAVGALSLQGTWNADTNTPPLVSGAGTTNHYYVVSTGGATNLDGITEWAPGDWALFDGAAWSKIDNSEMMAQLSDDPAPTLHPAAPGLDMANKPVLNAPLPAGRTVGGIVGSLILTDINRPIVTTEAAGVTIEVPADLSVNFPLWSVVHIFQWGIGQVTVLGVDSAIVRTAHTLSLRNQYSVASLMKRASDEWILFGDLQAAP